MQMFSNEEKDIINKKKKIRCILIVSFYAFVEYTWGVGYYRFLFQKNMLLSVSKVSSENILSILTQNMIVNLPIFVAGVIAAFIFRQELIDAFILREKKGKNAAAIVGILYVFMLFAALFFGKNTRVSIIYQWFYYLIFVGLAEEFSFRFFVPLLMEKGKMEKMCIWVVPGVLFGLMHTIMFVVQNGFSTELIVRGLSVIGGGLLGHCVFYVLRQYSGTIFIPIIIHAILDFSGTFSG